MKWVDRIGRRLKLNDLHIFLTVAEAGSMGKAAERLAVSQPSVSKAISDIEHTIGARLLDRTPRGVEITGYGRALLKRGMGAFDELRQGIRDIEFLTDPTAGEVWVGCSELIAAGFLLAVVERFSDRYPKVAVNVVLANNMWPELLPLHNRSVDLLIGRVTRPAAFDDVDIDILYEDRLFIVSGQNSEWARRRKIELAELVDERWLLSPDTEVILTRMLQEAFRAGGLALPRVNVNSYSIHQRIGLLASDRFVSALPGSVLRFNASRFSLKVLPVDLAIPPWPVAIVTLKNRTASPVVQTFIDCIREVATVFDEAASR
jgi:DNA-binding transcriptional LysR family regulator